ncbi:MAG: acetyl-CoA carboxylase biotin carboxyl carrier protein, partial [Holosporales bacterium]
TSGGVPAGTITAPMVGNVYLSARPGAAPFITVGDRVEKGQTLLIIEAMKVMNPIPSPKAGVVREIMVADGHPVEFGEPLLVLE